MVTPFEEFRARMQQPTTPTVFTTEEATRLRAVRDTSGVTQPVEGIISASRRELCLNEKSLEFIKWLKDHGKLDSDLSTREKEKREESA